NAALANAGNGITITSGGNTIGGTSSAARNLISGNTGDGVQIAGASATGNFIQGNFIGTNLNGTAALGNAAGHEAGVFINNAPGNTIGGTVGVAGNLISGNHGDAGILLQGAGSNANLVAGNFIGCDATGLAPLGHDNNGSDVQASNNPIGGTTAAARNVITSNGNVGIAFQGSTTTGNVVQGNFIGVGINGSTPLPNLGAAGVDLFSDGGNEII